MKKIFLLLTFLISMNADALTLKNFNNRYFLVYNTLDTTIVSKAGASLLFDAPKVTIYTTFFSWQDEIITTIRNGDAGNGFFPSKDSLMNYFQRMLNDTASGGSSGGATLTFNNTLIGASYNGSAPVTTGFNLANSNEWTALQTFTAATGIAIGTTSANATALLTMISTTKGLLPPVMTTVQMAAIGSPSTAATGLTIFNSTIDRGADRRSTEWALRTYTSDFSAGTATFSGDGVTKIFNIPHGLSTTPSGPIAIAASPNAARLFYVTADATNIIVTYEPSGPIAGVSNISFKWFAYK